MEEDFKKVCFCTLCLCAILIIYIFLALRPRQSMNLQEFITIIVRKYITVVSCRNRGGGGTIWYCHQLGLFVVHSRDYDHNEGLK